MSDAKYKLEDLIENLCSTGSPNLDETQLKQIKSICREDELNCKYSYEIVMTQLTKEHSEIRYSAFQIMDCLFQKSHVFRELVLDNFQTIFELVLEINMSRPLPPPKKAAAELKKLAPKVIKNWHDKFADVYKLLDLGFSYLKNCKKVDFVSFSNQTVAQRAHIQKQNEKQLIFQNKKYIEYVKQMDDSENDIKNCISQLERCIEILVPKVEDLFEEAESKKPRLVQQIKTVLPNEQENNESDAESDCSDDFEEVKPENSGDDDDPDIELRYLGFLSSKESSDYNLEVDVKLRENEENKIVIDIMRDLYKELKNSHLAKINTWLKNFNLIKTGTSNLKKAIELKNSIQSILKQFEALKIPIENTSPVKKTFKKSVTTEDSMPCTSKSKTLIDQLTDENEENEIDKERKKRRKLELEIAPVINLDELEFCATVTQKVDSGSHPLYQSREMDITESKPAPQLAKKTFVGKIEPVKWHCRAPLKNGKLCPRMDRYKCPFHGKIVARNQIGEIENEKDKNDPAVFKSQEESNKQLMPWQDPELIAEINAATGKNIQVIDPNNKKRKGNKKKSQQGNLTDLSKETESPRERLERRLFNTKNLNKVGSILDSIERRLHHEKFHHNFNYSINT